MAAIQLGAARRTAVLKWIIVVALVVLVTGLLQPTLARHLRMGRLPGDITIRRGGRSYLFPFTSTLLLSLLAWLLLRWL
jgi:DUF2905 family protein